MRQVQLKNQKGAVLIISVGAFILALGLLAISIDLGYIFYKRKILQNAVDAAAISSNYGFLNNKTEAVAAANEVASFMVYGPAFYEGGSEDLIVDADVKVGTWNFGGAGQFVENEFADPFLATQVTADLEVPLFFSRIFGRTSMNIERTATAIQDPRISTLHAGVRPSIVPFALKRSLVDPEGNGLLDNIGDIVDIYMNDYATDAGNFAFIELDPPDGVLSWPEVYNNFIAGFGGSLEITYTGGTKDPLYVHANSGAYTGSFWDETTSDPVELWIYNDVDGVDPYAYFVDLARRHGIYSGPYPSEEITPNVPCIFPIFDVSPAEDNSYATLVITGFMAAKVTNIRLKLSYELDPSNAFVNIQIDRDSTANSNAYGINPNASETENGTLYRTRLVT